MKSRLEIITPEIAAKYIAQSAGNRNISKKRVSQYAEAMKKGEWQVTHQGIAFNEKGVLVDGHHRLYSVIEAKIPVQMMVTYDVPECTTVFDRGFPRTLRQYLMYNEGIDAYLTDNLTIAIARLALQKKYGAKHLIPDTFIKDWLIENADVLKIVYSIVQIGQRRSSKTRTASFGLAIYFAIKRSVPIDRLKRFAEVVSTGFSESEKEFAAVVAKKELEATLGKVNNISTRVELCNQIQMLIMDFVDETVRKRKHATPVPVYEI